MPRPEKSIDPADGVIAVFALGLRELRIAAGLTYSDLAERANYSSTTLAEAANGRKLPSLPVTLAYVRACGGDEASWRRQWEQAKAGDVKNLPDSTDPGGIRQEPRPAAAGAPDPGAAANPADFMAAMRALRTWAGQPSYRELNILARKKEHSLPQSTLQEALTRDRFPSQALLIAFAAACNAPDEAEWLAAWRRLCPPNRLKEEEPLLTGVQRQTWLDYFLRRRFGLVFVSLVLTALFTWNGIVVSGQVLLPFRSPAVLRGKVAAVAADFFEDKEVQRILMTHDIRLDVVRAGSREVQGEDLDSHDFEFTSDEPSADIVTTRLAAKGRTTRVYRSFVSTLVLATFREYADTLRANGIVTATPANVVPFHYRVDMPPLLGLIAGGRTWNEIGIEHQGFANANKVAVSSDVCRSNSAVSYLGLVAYVVNHNRLPQTEQDAQSVAALVKPILDRQGLPTFFLFDQYASQDGRGTSSVVVADERQYISYQIRAKNQTGQLDPRRVLLYPDPGIQLQSQFIALTPGAERLGELITTDPDLSRRAIELGFRDIRPGSGETLANALAQQGVPAPVPPNWTHAPLPSLSLLDSMVDDVGQCRG